MICRARSRESFRFGNPLRQPRSKALRSSRAADIAESMSYVSSPTLARDVYIEQTTTFCCHGEIQSAASRETRPSSFSIAGRFLRSKIFRSEARVHDKEQRVASYDCT